MRGHRWISLTKARRGALMFYWISAWTNGWTNTRDAGDLRRHIFFSFRNEVITWFSLTKVHYCAVIPDSKLRWSHVGATWILSAPRWANVGATCLDIWNVLDDTVLECVRPCVILQWWPCRNWKNVSFYAHLSFLMMANPMNHLCWRDVILTVQIFFY